MPELEFKGKQHIYAHHLYAHHLSVPYRPLVPDAAKSIVADAAYAHAVNNINGGGGG